MSGFLCHWSDGMEFTAEKDICVILFTQSPSLDDYRRHFFFLEKHMQRIGVFSGIDSLSNSRFTHSLVNSL